MIPDTDKAYIAGLFDGEGCVSYKQYMRKRKHNKKPYPTWQIRLEITMTDKSLLLWLHEVLNVGTVNVKRYHTPYAVGWKKQWRWRCCHRDAYFVCKLLWPFAHIKLDGIQKIIAHYAKKKIKVKTKNEVIDFNYYKFWREHNVKEKEKRK